MTHNLYVGSYYHWRPLCYNSVSVVELCRSKIQSPFHLMVFIYKHYLLFYSNVTSTRNKKFIFSRLNYTPVVVPFLCCREAAIVGFTFRSAMRTKFVL